MVAGGLERGGGGGGLAAGGMGSMGIRMPVMYAVFGVIFGAISAWIYNLVAGWIGGIEVEVE